MHTTIQESHKWIDMQRYDYHKEILRGDTREIKAMTIEEEQSRDTDP